MLVGALVVALAASAPARAVPQFVLKWGSNGSGDNQFSGPSGVATDATGNVFVADTGNNRIKKFTPTGDFLVAAGTNTGGAGPGEFNAPRSVAADAAGNVYVSDTSNNRIQKLSSSLAFLTQWNSASSQIFNFPADVAVDAAGSVYLVDRGNNRVAKFTSEGAFQTQWTVGGTPTGVAATPDGNILVTDQTLHRVLRFTNTGGPLTGFGGPGPGAGQFASPAGIATDAVGNIYVADQSNNRIQKFAPDGSFLAAWGSAGAADGQFQGPLGVTVDAAGNIYVADTGNSRIEKFVEPADLTAAAPAPVATTVGSTVTLSVGGANAGPGVAFGSTLKLSVPSGVTILSAAPNQGTCAVGATSLSCSVGPVAAAGAPAATVTLRADAPVSGNSIVTLTSPTLDATASNNAASGQIVVSPAPPPPPPPSSGGPSSVTRRVAAQLRFRASIGPSGARFLALTILGAPKRARVAVSCTRKCAVRARRVSTGRRVDLLGPFRRRTVRTGAVIEIRVTRPGYTGRLFRLRIASRSIARTECGLRVKTDKPFGCTRL
jgi:DNA-binding beta-propeller fold protein YncE